MYDVISRHVRDIIVAVKSNEYMYFCVCARARVCGCVERCPGAWAFA
jgi:hypothetical protein